jgi:hypothetical protein
VIYRAFAAKTDNDNWGGFPEEAPKDAKTPKGERHFKDPSKVSAPTPSNTTGTPLPFVISSTLAVKSS